MKFPMFFMVLALIAGCSQSEAQDLQNEFYLHKTAVITKVEGLMTLIKDNQAPVYRCVRQELSDKATLKNKKKLAMK